MKKLLVLVMALVVMASLLAACAPAASPLREPAAAPAAKPAEGEIYIPVISKGFQHQSGKPSRWAPRMPRRK